jgi:hypothetical protein
VLGVTLGDLDVKSHKVVQEKEWSIRATPGMPWVSKPAAGTEDRMDLHQTAVSTPRSRAVLASRVPSEGWTVKRAP